MGPTPKHNDQKLNASERLDRELSASCSYLWGCAKPNSTSGLFALYIRRKVGGVWVAVAKRAKNDTGGAEVAFGSGRSIGTALAALNASMSSGKWKTDMPWKGS